MQKNRLTLEHLKKHPEKLSRFKKVYIFSEEHGEFWRSNYCGYTYVLSEAGVYSAQDAFDKTKHCGPEKKIVLVAAWA